MTLVNFKTKQGETETANNILLYCFIIRPNAKEEEKGQVVDILHKNEERLTWSLEFYCDAYFWVQLRAVASYLTLSLLYM